MKEKQVSGRFFVNQDGALFLHKGGKDKYVSCTQFCNDDRALYKKLCQEAEQQGFKFIRELDGITEYDRGDDRVLQIFLCGDYFCRK